MSSTYCSPSATSPPPPGGPRISSPYAAHGLDAEAWQASQELNRRLPCRCAAACLVAVLLSATSSEALPKREERQPQQHVPRVVYQASFRRERLPVHASVLLL